MAGSILFLEPRGTVMEVIRAAKKRGFYVIAIVSDPSQMETLPYPYDTARACIDEYVAMGDWQNHKDVLLSAEGAVGNHPINGVYWGVDAAALAGTILRQEFGLPTTQPEVMETILDKGRLRNHLRLAGLSHLTSYPSSEVETWTSWRPNNPCYFKPLHGTASAFVKRCQGYDDLRMAIRSWKSERSSLPSLLENYICREGNSYHLEEAIDGELLSVEAISSHGDFLCIGLTSRILYSKDPTVEMGSVFPYHHPRERDIIEQVKKAHQSLGMVDGPSHTEVIVSPEGQIEIIDLNPRFIGADVLQSINFAYLTHVEEVLVDWAVGKTLSPTLTPQQFSCIQYVLPPGKMIFQDITFPGSPEVVFSTQFKRPGDSISEVGRQLDYLGCYLTVMPTFEEALHRSFELREHVKINGKWGGEY